jgi:RNA polymerase sigma-70 factor (ECF subfamily)
MDREALAAFFDRHCDWTYSLVLRLVGDRHAAEEVTQDVFFRAHRGLKTFRDGSDMEPWLTSIVFNACRDHWRAQARRARRFAALDDLSESDVALRSDAPDPESQMAARQTSALVQRAIRSLPEDLRVAVVLHDYHGMPHEEIATLTGVSHDATRKRYSRALSRLGNSLKAIVR